MRHGDKIKNLSRTQAHRKALLSNLASQLIAHKRIITTLAKARALRTYVEPLLTKTKKNASKEEIMHQHRVVFSYLQNKDAVKELFTIVGPKIAGRPGGYTRIIKLGTRVGDNAEQALIELVDFNEVYVKGEVPAGTAKRTRRGGKRKSTEKPESTAEVKTKESPKAEKAEKTEKKEKAQSKDAE